VIIVVGWIRPVESLHIRYGNHFSPPHGELQRTAKSGDICVASHNLEERKA